MKIDHRKAIDIIVNQSLILKKMAPHFVFWVDPDNSVNKPQVAQLKLHQDTHLNYVFDMPFRCAVFRCPHKSWVHKSLTFFGFPTDPKLKQKWVAALKARAMNYKWQSNHRVCSAHFPGGCRYRTNNIPAAFFSEGQKTGQIVWPVDISYMLNAEATEAIVSSSNKTGNADVVCLSCKQVESEASDQQSEDTRRENIAKNDSHSDEFSPENACDY